MIKQILIIFLSVLMLGVVMPKQSEPLLVNDKINIVMFNQELKDIAQSFENNMVIVEYTQTMNSFVVQDSFDVYTVLDMGMSVEDILLGVHFIFDTYIQEFKGMGLMWLEVLNFDVSSGNIYYSFVVKEGETKEA